MGGCSIIDGVRVRKVERMGVVLRLDNASMRKVEGMGVVLENVSIRKVEGVKESARGKKG